MSSVKIPPPDYFLGLDLGQSQDFTALSVLERSWRVEDPEKPAELQTEYARRYLKRWHLGTSYTVIVKDVAELVTKPPLKWPVLGVDQTGVGRAVVNMFREADPAASLQPVLITAGHAVLTGDDGAWHVPKKELASVLQVLLQSRRLKVAPMPERELLAKELLAFRVKVTVSANETFECLTADTLVETSAGAMPINRVRAGDAVLTRVGPRRVLWAGLTKQIDKVAVAQLSTGRRISGTQDHLVWVVGVGWTPLGELQVGDELLGLEGGLTWADQGQRGRRSSCSTASNTADLQATPTTSTRNPRCPCTAPCGNSTKVPSPTGATSTTRTRTPTTTTSPTWSASPRKNTAKGTAPATHMRNAARNAGPYSSVAGCARPATPIREIDSAPGTALTEYAGLPSVGACNAASTSWAGTPACDSAPHPAVTVTATSTTTGRLVPVYDLVVDDAHEFFANGVLVHNSWRERDHDDMVLAVAIAGWLGERAGLPFVAPTLQPERRRTLADRYHESHASGAVRRRLFGR